MKENESLRVSIGKENTSVHLADLLPLIKESLSAGQKVKFIPYGTSMLPMIRQGVDSVTLAPAPERLKKYDIPLYIRDDGSFVLHRVVKVGESYTCVGDNQFIFEKGIEKDQIVAVLVEFERDGKIHTVSESGYKLYCRFWHFSRPIRRLWRRTMGMARKVARIILKNKR